MAAAFCRPAAGWIARRTAPGHAAQTERRAGGAGADHDAGIDAQGRHSLVDAVAGSRVGAEPKHREPHLARLRSPAAPQRDLQIIEGPAVHREGARYRWTLPEPTGPRSGVVRGREVSDSGVRPNTAAAPHAARTVGTAHSRLCAPWHDLPVRRPRREDWKDN